MLALENKNFTFVKVMRIETEDGLAQDDNCQKDDQHFGNHSWCLVVHDRKWKTKCLTTILNDFLKDMSWDY